MIIIIIIHHGALFVINQNLKPCWQELLFCQIIIMRTCKGPPRIINKIRRECFEWTIYSFHVSNILRQVKRIVVFVSPASAWMDKVFLLSLPLVGPLCPPSCCAALQIHLNKYTNTNTNSQIQIPKYKCTNTKSQIHTHIKKIASGDLLGALQ